MRILNSSLIIEEHFSNWSKNTQKRSNQRKNQHFCSETTGVIKNIMRKNWVTHKKHGETPKMGLKNKTAPRRRQHVILFYFAAARVIHEYLCKFREKILNKFKKIEKLSPKCMQSTPS